MIENVEQAKERFKRLVDFYKLNDLNNYDYDDRDLISMKLVLVEIERLEKRSKEIYEGFMATTQELCETTKENERLHSIIKEVRHYIKDTKQDGYKLVWIDKDNNYFDSGIEEILDKEKV